jgi:putative membrane protein
MMFWYGHPGIGWSIVMPLIMLAFWGGIAALVVYAVRGSLPRDMPHGGQPDPRQILAERLARGEIDADEYLSRLDVLDGKRW